MRIRKKTLFTVVATFIVLGVVLYLLSHYFVARSYSELEIDAATDLARRMSLQLEDEYVELSTAVADWARWDGTYEFMATRDPAYVEDNFYDAAFSGLNLQLIGIIDEQGELVVGRYFDVINARQTDIDESVFDYLGANSPYLDFETLTSAVYGLIYLHGRPMMTAAVAITNSNLTGTPRGAFIVGRFLNVYEVRAMAANLGTVLSVHRMDEQVDQSGVQTLIDQFRAGEKYVVDIVDDETIKSCILLEDMAGQPKAILSALQRRDIHLKGKETVTYFIGQFVLAGVVLAIILFAVLQKSLVTRIERIGGGVRTIRANKDLARRLPVTGRDELTGLTEDINDLLSRVAGSLDRAILSATSHQQARVAQDLHDDLGQVLTGISLAVESLRKSLGEVPDDVRPLIHEIQSQIHDAMDQTRQIASGLAPVEIQAGGIIYALHSLTKESRERFGLDCDVRCPAPAPELDEDTATHLYHIAKESITNAVRHGGASHVSIDLENGSAGISLVIADDGDGLPDDPPEAGLGLQLMRLRAEMIGGYLKIDSADGSGTRVECRVPSN